jgi:hypothetical protein
MLAGFEALENTVRFQVQAENVGAFRHNPQHPGTHLID